MADRITWCREELGAGLRALEEARRALVERQDGAPDVVRRLAHRLHGVAEANDLAEVTRAAAEVLQPGADSEAAVDRLLETLRQEAGRAAQAEPAELLVVEDDAVTARVIQAALEGPGRTVVVVQTGAAARAWLGSHDPGVVLLDLSLPDQDGRSLLLWLRREPSRTDCPVVVLTGKEDHLAQAECVALGANAYLRKPFDPEALRMLVVSTLGGGGRRRTAPLPAADGSGLQDLVGDSRPMRRVYERIGLAAPVDVTVLLTGESGTGKEMAARAIHRLSRRRDGPFVGVNCSAFSETLLESELFGHVRGSFTDAIRDKPGVFQMANGGTLFLDEIGDLSPLLQLKLLRVLQEREVRRVGDDRGVRVDVRLIAATNRDLREQLATHAIRDDFYYRIRVFEIVMPPLRDRPEDVPLLVGRFLEELEDARRKGVRGISREALATLRNYAWPGNVRELRNAVEHALVTVRGENLEVADLPEEVRARAARPRSSAAAAGEETSRILAALAEADGHRARAARRLGISRITLWKKLRRIRGEETARRPARAARPESEGHGRKR